MDRNRQRMARDEAKAAGIDLSADFHALPISQKAELSEIARRVRYRAPVSAAGRSACYSFFIYLNKGVA